MKKGGVLWVCAVLLVLIVFGLAACGSQTAADPEAPEGPTGEASAPPQSFTWSADSDCSLCHEQEVASSEGTTLTATAHATQGIDCLGCHEAADLEKYHDGVTLDSPSPKLGSVNYLDKFCLKCHESYDALAAKTVGSTAFQAADGTYVNPHATHQGQVACSECHSIHSDSNPINYCYGCHHSKKLECGTCHEIKQ